MSDNTVRVNKLLAHATGMSRREADNAIESGRVLLNGARAVIGSQARPNDTVQLDNKVINAQSSYTYLLFHKPVDYVCSRKRQGDTATIFELLSPAHQKLKPVGRLDKDSSGLLLLTDDGDFAHRMTHPGFQKQKIYEVSLDHELEPLHQQMINDHGISLEDGNSKLTLERLSDDTRISWRVIMHEGRNRQIRRTFAALGYTVTELHRTQFGPYQLNDLAAGQTRVTSP